MHFAYKTNTQFHPKMRESLWAPRDEHATNGDGSRSSASALSTLDHIRVQSDWYFTPELKRYPFQV